MDIKEVKVGHFKGEDFLIKAEKIIRSEVYSKQKRKEKQGGIAWEIISDEGKLLHLQCKRGEEKFLNTIPKTFILDPVFLGLWIGDGLTSIDKRNKIIKHLGFSNSNSDNIKYFTDYLIYLNQDLDKIKATIHHGDLVLNSRIKNAEDYLAKIKIKDISFKTNKTDNLSKGANGISVMITVQNTPLSFVFTEIIKNFKYILRHNPVKFKIKFLAGLFSAEGSADKGSNKFQWATTKSDDAKIIVNLLKEGGFKEPIYSYKQFYVKVGYNKENRKEDFELFKRDIIPHIPSSKKRKECQDLVNDNRIREHDIMYFSSFLINKSLTIKKCASNFNITHSRLSTILISFLNQKLLTREGSGQGLDPFVYSITRKGNVWFKTNFKSFRYIIGELDRLGYYGRCFKKKDIVIFNKLKEIPC